MKDIAIYGAGGLGREVACMLEKINKVNEVNWNLIGFFDDGCSLGDEVSHFGKVLGGINELNNWPTPLNVALCFGNPKILSQVRGKITNPVISFPNLIDPDFVVDDPQTFTIGMGNIIKTSCLCTTNIKIGDFNIFNSFISIGHDVRIGNSNCFMPAVRVSGEVKIGNGNLFGAGSFIKQQLKIGDGMILSPLSALLTKPKDGSLYIGNPAKIMKF